MAVIKPCHTHTALAESSKLYGTLIWTIFTFYLWVQLLIGWNYWLWKLCFGQFSLKYMLFNEAVSEFDMMLCKGNAVRSPSASYCPINYMRCCFFIPCDSSSAGILYKSRPPLGRGTESTHSFHSSVFCGLHLLCIIHQVTPLISAII